MGKLKMIHSWPVAHPCSTGTPLNNGCTEIIGIVDTQYFSCTHYTSYIYAYYSIRQLYANISLGIVMIILVIYIFLIIHLNNHFTQLSLFV